MMMTTIPVVLSGMPGANIHCDYALVLVAPFYEQSGKVGKLGTL